MNADALLNAWATDAVRADARIAELEHDLALAEERMSSLESDVAVYREIGNSLMDALVHVTANNQHLKTINWQLRDENRALYEELHVRSDADVGTAAEELEGAPA